MIEFGGWLSTLLVFCGGWLAGVLIFRRLSSPCREAWASQRRINDSTAAAIRDHQESLQAVCKTNNHFLGIHAEQIDINKSQKVLNDRVLEALARLEARVGDAEYWDHRRPRGQKATLFVTRRELTALVERLDRIQEVVQVLVDDTIPQSCKQPGTLILVPPPNHDQA